MPSQLAQAGAAGPFYVPWLVGYARRCAVLGGKTACVDRDLPGSGGLIASLAFSRSAALCYPEHHPVVKVLGSWALHCVVIGLICVHRRTA